MSIGMSAEDELKRMEFADMLLAEYRYWRNQDNPDIDGIATGAMAATSNVLSALYGHEATHHDKCDDYPIEVVENLPVLL